MTASRFGELARQLGIESSATADGAMVVQMPVTEEVLNSAGSLQGGLIATIADVAAGRLALAVRTDGRGVTTTTMTLNYLAPVTVGPARAVATVLRSGKRTAVVQVQVHDAGRDELCAVALVGFAAVPR